MFEERQLPIEARNLMMLEAHLKLEALAARKSQLYSGYFQDPVLKGYAQQLASHHKDNIASLMGYLNELQ